MKKLISVIAFLIIFAGFLAGNALKYGEAIASSKTSIPAIIVEPESELHHADISVQKRDHVRILLDREISNDIIAPTVISAKVNKITKKANPLKMKTIQENIVDELIPEECQHAVQLLDVPPFDGRTISKAASYSIIQC